MRVVFTGGGTGGHIFPNIAVIEEFKKFPSAEIFYIGGRSSMEEELVKKMGVKFFGIHTGKLRRYFSFKNFIDCFKAPAGFFESILVLKKIKPDLVFAKGGYVSVPVVLAAKILKIPVWLHESDVTLGMANKIAGKFAEKIWLSFEESKKYFPGKNAEVVGNPIRRFLFNGSPDSGYKLTGFSRSMPIILVTGGSIGAVSLNNLIEKILPELLMNTQVIHITGKNWKPSKDYGKNYSHFEFLNNELADVYSISDLVISRAGSGGIFEVLACGKPLLLVPLPLSASRGDQIENAKIFEKHGWAKWIDQDSASKESFLATVFDMLKIRKKQNEIKYINASQKIALAMDSMRER